MWATLDHDVDLTEATVWIPNNGKSCSAFNT
jgi:hypothetical protein